MRWACDLGSVRSPILFFDDLKRSKFRRYTADEIKIYTVRKPILICLLGPNDGWMKNWNSIRWIVCVLIAVFNMENVEVSETTSTPIHNEESSINRKTEDSECKVSGAVDIVDHYAIKSNESSDSTLPSRPPRKYSDYSSDSISSSRKTSESMESSPIKPSRKLSQCSTNRKFSTASDTSSIKTPKKVSFSDELPLAAVQLAAISGEKPDIQMPSEYLNTLTHAMMESNMLKSIPHSSDEDDDDDDEDEDDREDDTDQYSSPSSSISTQTLNELTKADMFPNSRKVSMHSERSFDMDTSSTIKPGKESATTQITTETDATSPLDLFLDSERKMSTTSMKSNYCASSHYCRFVIWLPILWASNFQFIFLITEIVFSLCM